jgi:excisionase family DNA binding protein
MGKLLSTTEVAARLGITVPRIQTFIWEGRLPAQKVGRSYAIDEDDLKLIEHRQTGRPPKAQANGATKKARGKK